MDISAAGAELWETVPEAGRTKSEYECANALRSDSLSPAVFTGIFHMNCK